MLTIVSSDNRLSKKEKNIPNIPFHLTRLTWARLLVYSNQSYTCMYDWSYTFNMPWFSTKEFGLPQLHDCLNNIFSMSWGDALVSFYFLKKLKETKLALKTIVSRYCHHKKLTTTSLHHWTKYPRQVDKLNETN